MAQDMKSMQKTCFIVTAQLGHICKKTDWEQVSEDEQIWELQEHWNMMLKLPNLKLARGQIERSPTTGRLHIQAALKFSKVWRARTLENKWKCWAEPALDEQAVLKYAKKTDTRVAELPNFGVVRSKAKTGPRNPKQKAIELLLEGWSPVEICEKYPEVFFTHHRAITETWKMMQASATKNCRVLLDEEE